jgi:phosphinothricin acetyltransferase
LAVAGDLPAVLALLEENGLPPDGLEDHLGTLLVARGQEPGGRVVGSAALELHGEAALLRSVAVEADARGQGLGGRLVRAALDLAEGRGIGTVYLLTEGADGFFEGFGFRPVSRAEVAEAAPGVARSVEFATVCPTSAQAMVRHEGNAHARTAVPGDAVSIAWIHNQGIEDRIATFETEPRSASEVLSRLDSEHLPVVVVELGGEVVAFAASSPYSPRECYQGVAEFSVYVARERRGRGLGRVAMEALLEAAEEAGLWKIVGRVFVENEPSRRLLRSLGFREVGVHEKHARLDGEWRDVVVVEWLLPEDLV